MFNNIGSIYKEIRESKNLTQSAVCKNILSRSNLANFECNKSIPSYEKMAFLLRQLDITFEEFAYICNHYKPDKRQLIIQKALNMVSVSNNKEIEDFLKEVKTYLQYNQEDVPIRRLYQKLDIVLSVRQSDFSPHAKKLAEKVWSEIERYDTWYESDIKMLNVILFYFPIEIVQNITEKILDSLERYKDYKNIKETQFSILVNLSTIYLYNDLPQDCERITKVLLDLSKTLKRYDYLGLSFARLGICQQDASLLKKGLDLLELTEEKRMVAGFKEEVANYFSAYPYPLEND